MKPSNLSVGEFSFFIAHWAPFTRSSVSLSPKKMNKNNHEQCEEKQNKENRLH